IPEVPTWDLEPAKYFIKISSEDLVKLEKCSMLTIDKKIEADLNDAINVVERMCNVKISDEINSLIFFDYLG
ncbi:hypothetical protein BpHYR1_027702, partial [Brachionus plicatilis]